MAWGRSLKSRAAGAAVARGKQLRAIWLAWRTVKSRPTTTQPLLNCCEDVGHHFVIGGDLVMSQIFLMALAELFEEVEHQLQFLLCAGFRP